MNQTNMLEEVFSQAIQMPDAEARRQYVQQACDGYPQLAEQVLSLLIAAREAGRFLEPAVPGRYPAMDPAQPTHHASSKEEFPFLRPPIVADDLGSLGPYRILQCVGRGGMGIVFRAFDSKLQRIVAVKVLAPEIAIEPMARRRFEREARSAAAVSHPNVVVIHAVDETYDPPYLVMEFVQGTTLAEKLASQGALSVKEILRIGAQMAEGLAAAHAQGLAHRDIKPPNILLENGVERVKVTDFGLAKAVHDVAMTLTGDLSGTPQFMSPEQASGERVDHRTDLFSLGAVLYTMCTGRPPFRADSIVATLKRICEDTPRPMEHINPEVPGWLSEIVNRLLAKSPEDRFQSAAEVATRLRQHLAIIQEGPSTAETALNTNPRFAWNLRSWPWPMITFGFLACLALNAALSSSLFNAGIEDPLSRTPDGARQKAAEAVPDGLPPEEAAKKIAAGPDSQERNEPPSPIDGGTFAGDRRVLNDMEMAFHWCPPGRFLMGSPKSEVGNNSDERQVEMTMPCGFWMQETEVTQSEWASLMGSLPSPPMRGRAVLKLAVL